MADAFPRPRWYRLTPDRAVLGLLAVEGLLLLSQWFEWFAFNRHKGWTLSICLATVAAAFLLMLLWFLAALVFRLRFQFSILSLLVLVVVVAIPCSWLAAARKQAEKQREAVEEIRNAFGQVSYDYEYDPSGWQIPGPPGRPEPAWLRGLLGDDLFASVTQVHVNLPEFGDAGLKHLDGLPELQVLDLCGTTVERRRTGAPRRIAPTPGAGPHGHPGQRRRTETPQRIDPTPRTDPPVGDQGRRRRAGTPQGH